MSREQMVADRAALEDKVEEYVNKGYKVKSKSDTEAQCVESGFGSIWWHLLFLFTTAGFGNLIYAIYKRISADKVFVRIDESL